VAAEALGELEQLRAACIYIDSDEDTVNKLALSLRKIYSLRSLDMKRGGDHKSSKTLNFLHKLDSSPPRLLQFLKLQGTLSELPNWVGSLTHLVEVDISRAVMDDENEQLFGMLSEAPNLRSIILQLNFYSKRELVARTVHKFSALKKLVVSLYCEFPEVFTVEEGSMRNLEVLSLEFGGRESARFCGIKHLESMKEVYVSGQKHNSALVRTLKELKTESDNRPNSSKFKVAPGYW
jgi:disease resistance protein RPM1